MKAVFIILLFPSVSFASLVCSFKNQSISIASANPISNPAETCQKIKARFDKAGDDQSKARDDKAGDDQSKARDDKAGDDQSKARDDQGTESLSD